MAKLPVKATTSRGSIHAIDEVENIRVVNNNALPPKPRNGPDPNHEQFRKQSSGTAPTTGSASSNSSSINQGVNVKVVLRCRPFSLEEHRHAMANSVSVEHETIVDCKETIREVVVTGRRSTEGTKTYTFDGVCGPHTSQEYLFDHHILPLVEEVLQGFNCTIFAYGQTGTGKTYTMEGNWARDLTSEPPTPANSNGPQSEQPVSFSLPKGVGVIPRAVALIFQRLKLMDLESSLKVSFMEIYNEELNDLLQEGERVPLRIYDSNHNGLLGGGATRGLAVKNLQEVPVESLPEVYSILSYATKKRKTAETSLNRKSSRSHSIFTITITMKEAAMEGEDIIRIGKLNLVDLAGSENIQVSAAILDHPDIILDQRSGTNQNKDRAKEAGIINQSLVALGRVINALTGPATFVPYRDSKLTRLLQESLGGRTKTCIIATISPAVTSAEETISTLDYAHRAKHIKNRPEVNQKVTQKYVLKEMSTELERLRKELALARDKSGEVILTTDMYNDLEAQINDYQILKKNHTELRKTVELQEFDITELNQRLSESETERFDLAKESSLLKEKLNLKLNQMAEMSEALFSHGVILRYRNDQENEKHQVAELYSDVSKLSLRQMISIIDEIKQDISVFENLTQTADTNMTKLLEGNDTLNKELARAARLLEDGAVERMQIIEGIKAECHNIAKSLGHKMTEEIWTSDRLKQLTALMNTYLVVIENTEVQLDQFSKEEEREWTRLFEIHVVDKNTESLAKLSEVSERLLRLRVIRQKKIDEELNYLKHEREVCSGSLRAFVEFFTAKFRELSEMKDRVLEEALEARRNFDDRVLKLASAVKEQTREAVAAIFQSQDKFLEELAQELNETNKGDRLFWEDNLNSLVGPKLHSELQSGYDNVLNKIASLHKSQKIRQNDFMGEMQREKEVVDGLEVISAKILKGWPDHLVGRQNDFMKALTRIRQQIQGEALSAMKQSVEIKDAFLTSLSKYLLASSDSTHEGLRWCQDQLDSESAIHTTSREKTQSILITAQTTHSATLTECVSSVMSKLRESGSQRWSSGRKKGLDSAGDLLQTMLQDVHSYKLSEFRTHSDLMQDLKGLGMKYAPSGLSNALMEFRDGADEDLEMKCHSVTGLHEHLQLFLTKEYGGKRPFHPLKENLERFGSLNAIEGLGELSKLLDRVETMVEPAGAMCDSLTDDGSFVELGSNNLLEEWARSLDHAALQRFLRNRPIKESIKLLKNAALLGLLQLEISGCVIDQLTNNELERILAQNAAHAIPSAVISPPTAGRQDDFMMRGSLHRAAHQTISRPLRYPIGHLQRGITDCALDILKSYYEEKESSFQPSHIGMFPSHSGDDNDSATLYRCQCRSHQRKRHQKWKPKTS